jgi:hypothetical protein
VKLKDRKCIKKGNYWYYQAFCLQCGKDRGYQRQSHLEKRCRSCAQKQRLQDPKNNPMYGKKHQNTEKFRKNSYAHYNYDDVRLFYSDSGNKRIQYRKQCPVCLADMGYHYHVDASRTCRSCQHAARRKYTKSQKRLRNSVKANISARFRRRNLKKNYSSSFSMLPYTFEELVEYIESKFQQGMTWDNYGQWEVDHITPDSWFEYNSYNDKGFKDSWALNNLQPLWKIDNARKGNKYKG